MNAVFRRKLMPSSFGRKRNVTGSPQPLCGGLRLIHETEELRLLSAGREVIGFCRPRHFLVETPERLFQIAGISVERLQMECETFGVESSR